MSIKEVKNLLEGIEIKTRPTEKSVINHNIRDRLKINSDQYCICDLIERLYIKNKNYAPYELSRKLGFDAATIKSEVKILIGMRILEKKDGESPKTSDMWKRMFIVSEEDFEEFMKPHAYGTRTIKWTGSKSDAKTKYEKARKLYSAIYLLDRKKAYFDFLSKNEKRDIMMASVFLNVKTKRFSEDWETYGNVPKVVNKQNVEPSFYVSRTGLIDL